MTSHSWLWSQNCATCKCALVCVVEGGGAEIICSHWTFISDCLLSPVPTLDPHRPFPNTPSPTKSFSTPHLIALSHSSTHDEIKLRLDYMKLLAPCTFPYAYMYSKQIHTSLPARCVAWSHDHRYAMITGYDVIHCRCTYADLIGLIEISSSFN